MPEQFNAVAARSLAARAKDVTPTKQLEAIKKAAQLGKTETWFENLSSFVIRALEDLGFRVESIPDRNETANKVSW